MSHLEASKLAHQSVPEPHKSGIVTSACSKWPHNFPAMKKTSNISDYVIGSCGRSHYLLSLMDDSSGGTADGEPLIADERALRTK